jgi:hypothetical protein
VLITLALADAKDAGTVARNIMAHDVRGVLIGPIYPYENAVMAVFAQMRSLAIPVVAFGYGLQPVGDDVILIDERKAGHLAVANHHSGIDELARSRALEQRTDHDRLGGEAAIVLDEAGLGSLAGARSAVQPDDFIRKLEPLDADLIDQILPSGIENEIGVFDFEIDGLRSAGFGS